MDRLLKPARMHVATLVVTTLLLWCGIAVTADEELVDDETCLACHEYADAQLKFTPHALSSQIDNPAAKIACVSCHSNGAVHIEEPMVENIGNPARMEGVEAIDACTKCHQPHHTMSNFAFDPHAGKEIKCTDCHSVHSGYEGLLVDEEAGFCASCHPAVVNQFRSRSNHPVTDGNVTCLSCHDFTGDDEPMFGHGKSANCFSCHPETSGPFIHEHQAASAFGTEGDNGCMNCHRPHGSANDRLLNQPGDALCQQCHGVPPLHRTFHNGIGTQYGCVECHSAVHGSNDNPGLLDEFIGTKLTGDPAGCFCHNVDN